MKSLRRHNFDNRLYFITCVTFNRQEKLLTDIELFWKSWKISSPIAWVILSDHFHIIIDSKQLGISNVIHNFKRTYAWNYNRLYEKGRVWQNRFWDHLIRDEEDLKNHLDYIHYNPVKHNIVDDSFKYQYSSLRDYYEKGYYQRDWGSNVMIKDIEYGE